MFFLSGMNHLENHKKNIKESILNYINQNHLKEAEELINQYESIIPNDLEIYHAKSIVYIQQEKYQLAERILKDAVHLDNNNSDTYYNLGYLYQIINDIEKSYKYYKLAKELSDDVEFQSELESILMGLEKEVGIVSPVPAIQSTKKVLMIAHIFPPIGGSGVQRTLKFVKYIKSFGWEPIIVTAGKSNYPLNDKSLLCEIPDDTRIIRIDEDMTVNPTIVSEIHSLIEGMISDKNLYEAYKESSLKNTQILSMPDPYIFWANKVLKELKKYIDVSEVDLIYTTSGPYSDHIIGYYLKDEYKKPWVADFRDEWTNNPYIIPDKNSLLFKTEYALEEKIVHAADKIINVTPRSTENCRDNFQLLNEKVVTITNGYDEEDFKKIVFSESKNEKFTVIHNGLLYSIRTPITFMLALHNLIRSKKIDPDHIRVCFSWTNNDEQWIKYSNELQLGKIVEFYGYVSHKESLQLASNADLLLLIVGPGEKNNAMYPGKLFEYLRLKKPILALSPENGVVDQLIMETDRGYNVDFDDIEGIEQSLLEEYNKWLIGNGSIIRSDSKIEEYERKNLTGQLSQVFHSVSSTGTKSKGKIVFFSIKNGDKFLHDIIDDLSKDYHVRKIIVTNYSQIDEGMRWADICWFEWCDQLISYGSKLEIAKEKRILCRIHRYEVFTNNIVSVNWINVDKLIVVTDHLVNIIEKVVPNIKEFVDIETVENGVNLNKFQFRRRNTGFNLAYVGDMNYRKNPFFMLQIMRKLVSIDKNYKLFIAGSFTDKLIEEYWNYSVIEMGLENNIQFQGWQEDVYSWLENADYLLAPTIHESFGFYIAEAMAVGIKPIIHNFLYAREIWPEHYLFNTIDEAVEKVISEEYKSSEYRDFIHEHYSLEKQLLKTRNIIDNLIKDENRNKDVFSFIYKDEIVYFYLPNDKDYIQSTIKNNNKFYESTMLEEINLRGISGKTVIDVGANIGNHTIFFSRIANAEKVYCFEPFKHVFDILDTNIKINNLSHKVKAFNVAVGSVPGKAVIDIVDDNNLGMNRVSRVNNGNIDVVTLDDMLMGVVDSVDLIKIDVEGMGLDVLKGAINIIELYKPDIYIEADTDKEYQKIVEILSEFRYVPIKKYNWTPTYLFRAEN